MKRVFSPESLQAVNDAEQSTNETDDDVAECGVLLLPELDELRLRLR